MKKETVKNIVIAGGKGFLGKALEKHFIQTGYNVQILTRDPVAKNHHQWDGMNEGPWTKQIEKADVVINLCGKSVDCRYTTGNKKEILDSRLKPTRLLDKVIRQCTGKPSLFINASSATIYIHSEDKPMTEKSGITGHDFSMNVVRKWEEIFFEKEIEGVRKVALRTSIVLGTLGGALPKLLQIAKVGLGGRQGNGKQMVSWVHVDDFCRSVVHIMNTRFLEGSINITAPHPLSNEHFMANIRRIVKPMFHLHQPKWLLELGAIFLRTETELLLKSRYVIPERLIGSGFVFLHPSMKDLKKNSF